MNNVRKRSSISLHLDDVLVVEPGNGPCLPAEFALETRVHGQVVAEHLDGHRPVRASVVAVVDDGEGAPSRDIRDDVTADAAVGRELACGELLGHDLGEKAPRAPGSPRSTVEVLPEMLHSSISVIASTWALRGSPVNSAISPTSSRSRMMASGLSCPCVSRTTRQLPRWTRQQSPSFVALADETLAGFHRPVADARSGEGRRSRGGCRAENRPSERTRTPPPRGAASILRPRSRGRAAGRPDGAPEEVEVRGGRIRFNPADMALEALPTASGEAVHE